MNKISLIIRREYLTRVRKRSFVIMTILGPILMAALMILPAYFAQKSDEDRTIGVVDESGIFFKKIPDTDNLKFTYITEEINTAKNNMNKEGLYAILYIPKPAYSVPTKAILYSDKQPGINIKSHIKSAMEKEVEQLKLQASGINEDVLNSIKSDITLASIKMGEKGNEEKSFVEVSMILGMFSGILIYFFIFLFGAQVMRGVIEEKTSRIVEVIISSVKPFQLMMGKIIGVALVGLTQFLLWVLLTIAIVGIFKVSNPGTFSGSKPQQMMTDNRVNQSTANTYQQQANNINENQGIFEAIGSIDFGVMIGSFLFYFLFGYLLYAAFFAAIGSAVDNDADTQQFMLPITIPLIFSIVMAQYVINNPDGPLSFWLSIIPLTSPIIMMIRIPFGVPFFDLILSMVLLVLGFIAATWLAAKIYRTGILLYGKKVDYKELWKWIKYKG